MTVRLLDVPVRLRFASLEHSEALIREMTLLNVAGETGGHVPARLLALAEEVTTEYGPFVGGQAAALEDAHLRGLAVVPEVVYVVPPVVGELARRIRTLLAEADDYCRRGDLLTLTTPPDVERYRSWLLGEFEHQIAGSAATPWPAYLAAHAN